MTTTLRPPDAPRVNGTPPPVSPALAPKQRPTTALRRNRSRIGVGVVVIVLSVLGALALVSRGAERISVLALARDVPAGRTITAEDLTTVELPLDTGLPIVPATNASEIVGQSASVTLTRGTLLTRSHVSVEARIPEGMALLGTVLDPGQYPVDLHEGDQVRLIVTSPAAAGQPNATEDLGTAEVREMAEPPTGPRALVVSLLVPNDLADRVSAAGAEGRISLVVIGSR